MKRIWTPSWTLFSGGWCFLLLPAFYAVVDLAGWRKPAFPLVVIGMNSIAAYMIAHLFEDFIRGSLRTHLGAGHVRGLRQRVRAVRHGAVRSCSCYWLILFWMYQTEAVSADLTAGRRRQVMKAGVKAVSAPVLAGEQAAVRR